MSKLIAQVGEDTVVTLEISPNPRQKDRITVEIDRGDIRSVYEIKGHIEHRTEPVVKSSDGTN